MIPIFVQSRISSLLLISCDPDDDEEACDVSGDGADDFEEDEVDDDFEEDEEEVDGDVGK